MPREPEVNRRHDVVIPSDAENAQIERGALGDPDAALLSAAELDAMVPLPRLRGRPRSDHKKALVSIRYSAEVLEYFRSTGAGWQSRMDAVLREFVHRATASPDQNDKSGDAGRLTVT